MTRVLSYVVRLDYGFAPNPFHNVCTLATCKPDVRKQARVGDWIVGTGSGPKGYKQCLIYTMQVSEKLTFQEYWESPRFQCKKPNLSGSLKTRFGDNIYCFDAKKRQWIQSNSHHSFEHGRPNAKNIARDTGTNSVLIGRRFVYYGREAPRIPENIAADLCKKGPSHKSRFSDPFVNSVLEWLMSLPESGFVGEPIDWEPDIRKQKIQLT